VDADRGLARDRNWARQALIADPVIRVGAVVFLLLAIPYLVPLFSADQMLLYAEDVTDLPLLALVLVAFQAGLRSVDHPEHRRFWTWLTVAYAFWIGVRLFYVLFPYLPGTPVGDITGDGFYLGFYLFVVLASLLRPHAPPGWTRLNRSYQVELASSVAFLLAVFAYFVAVPSAVNYAAYDTWLPSLYMYLVLDGFLIWRFLRLRSTCQDARFRTVYGLLALTATCWFVTDLVECLSYAGVLDLAPGSPADLLWWPSFMTVIAAARLRGADAVEASRDNHERDASPLRAIGPLVLLTFVFPALHFGLYGFGLLDAESRPAREVVVFAALLLLGGLVLLRQLVLETTNRSLRSDLHRIEERLEHSRRLEAIGQLAGGVAHDFNNLLTSIIGESQMAMQRLPENDPMHEAAGRIDRSAQRAATLTRQLLAFGRRQVLQPETIDLNRVVDGVEDMLRRVLGDRIELNTRFEPDLYPIHADPAQIEQILMNLAANAREAMPRGGDFEIMTSNAWFERDPFEDIDDGAGSAYAVVEVRDSGCGMDDVTRDRVFEPFFTTKRHGKGRGLGLATVYGTVKQSGGQILLDSALGEGSVFRIYLPATPEDTAALRPDAAGTSEVVGGETILLVEDQEEVRSLARDVLELDGYTVIEACDGEDAVAAFEDTDRTIDLLLTDVVMPRMGGVELARALEERQPELPVLFVSGYTDHEVFADGPPGARSAFLAKPFTPYSLTDKVREMLSRDD
jgi:signal transduction histidine kinase/CheY-like chemotaxis protein